jgi:hypothetical protein
MSTCKRARGSRWPSLSQRTSRSTERTASRHFRIALPKQAWADLHATRSDVVPCGRAGTRVQDCCIAVKQERDDRCAKCAVSSIGAASALLLLVANLRPSAARVPAAQQPPVASAPAEVECVPCSRGACGRCLPRSSFTHRPSSGCTACMIGAGEVEDGQTMVVGDAQRLPGTA